MRPTNLNLISLALAAALGIPGAEAATFERTRIAPELGLDALTRGVAREQVGRDVFSGPYSAVTLSRVDVYPVFPYVESRSFEVVSDPRWNRLVFGEAGRTLRAYDGAGTSFGRLKDPRSLAVDEWQHVYVADAGNNRVLVLEARTEFDQITLTPRFEIAGLSDPHGVAYSDGGTPFHAGDDLLYVADTGKNRVAAFALSSNAAREVASVGALGSGPGRFAGPMAVAAGRRNGASTPDVYVADAHTRRIVRLRFEGSQLSWVAETQIAADLVTSLDTDQWGNLYAAAPRWGAVQKFSPTLAPVAELREGLSSPRAFHVPFVTVADHRTGRTERTGQANGLAVERWDLDTGMKLWKLGLEISPLTVDARSGLRFTLTDQAAVTIETVDAASGRTVSRRSAGEMEAGPHQVALTAEESDAAGSRRILRVAAASSYPNGPTVTAQTAGPGDGLTAAPREVGLLGYFPNPATPSTQIFFAIAAGSETGASLRLFDASGRRVRDFGSNFNVGLNQVAWDGTDERGHEASAGVYFLHLDIGSRHFSRKLVLVR